LEEVEYNPIPNEEPGAAGRASDKLKVEFNDCDFDNGCCIYSWIGVKFYYFRVSDKSPF
jgi:hypothetical protein